MDCFHRTHLTRIRNQLLVRIHLLFRHLIYINEKCSTYLKQYRSDALMFVRHLLFIPIDFVLLQFSVYFQLLGELLLDRYNFSVMTKYITNTDNLKQQMNLLKEKSKNIQFEAFHVFKVFALISFSVNDLEGINVCSSL